MKSSSTIGSNVNQVKNVTDADEFINQVANEGEKFIYNWLDRKVS